MKKIMILIGIYLFENCFIFGQGTNVPGGEVSGTWTKANSPYLIHGAIMIANDSTLTIEPGVSVIFQGTFKLLVLGRLLAVGTVTDSIIFTAADTASGWKGIRFDNTQATNDTSKFFYCKLNYGKAYGNGEDANGGSFYFRNFSKVIIFNSNISFNSSSYGGGGIYCFKCSPLFSNNYIYNNSASSRGGGIYLEESSPAISNNSISNNSSSDMGGGIDCSYDSSPTISNNIISYNSADRGGGINCYWYSNPNISNNTISNNSSSIGGGVYCENYYLSISNNIITNNSATQFGGGMYCIHSSPTISNNTFSNNTATKGGALYCTSSSIPNLLNTLLWGNIATTTGNQVYLDSEESDPNFYYCDVQGGKLGFGLNTNIFYTGMFSNNLDQDPLFVDTTIADWSLQSNSPCIDAGDSSGTYPLTDKAGNPRICDGRIDIGAYEFQKTPCNITIGFNEESNKQISIFPNPTNNNFYLDIENIDNGNIEITLANILGKEVIKTNYNNIPQGRFIKEIDMKNLTNQIYIVWLKINEQVYLRKITKIK